MGIYIKGIDMPLACAPCPVKYWCGLWSKVTLPAHIRHPDCPMVEVPAHGRLVDADNLCKVLKARAADEWNQGTAPFSLAYAYDCMADTVDTMPTVIPKEET